MSAFDLVVFDWDGTLMDSTAAIVRATVVRERRATFSLAPGQPARPSNRTALPGFVLAGDWR